MAKARSRSRKKTKTRSTAKKGSKKPTKRSTTARRTSSARKKVPAPAIDETMSEVEQRWQEYWTCRKELEEAVATVREAEASLAAARELEHERRTIFESTKDSLKRMLEVEPASSSSPAGSRSTGPTLVGLEHAVGGEELDHASEADDDEETLG